MALDWNPLKQAERRRLHEFEEALRQQQAQQAQQLPSVPPPQHNHTNWSTTTSTADVTAPDWDYYQGREHFSPTHKPLTEEEKLQKAVDDAVSEIKGNGL